jgi:uncharacterized protein (TIGR03546 family)
MFFLNLIKNLLTILQSEISPKQIAGGAALGSMIGFTPFSALHNLVIFILIMILRVNISAAFFSIALFGLIGLATDPIADKIGYFFLVQNQSLTPFWTKLYNMPIVPFTKFNNTVVLGGIVLSLILFIPIYFGTKGFVLYYRANLKEKVAALKIMKLFKLSNIYKFYERVK